MELFRQGHIYTPRMEPSLQVHNILPGWSPPFKFTIYAVDGALPSSSQYTPWMEPSLQVHNICRGWSSPFKFTIYAVDGALPSISHIYAADGDLSSSSQYTPCMELSLQVHNIRRGWSLLFKYTCIRRGWSPPFNFTYIRRGWRPLF